MFSFHSVTVSIQIRDWKSYFRPIKEERLLSDINICRTLKGSLEKFNITKYY